MKKKRKRVIKIMKELIELFFVFAKIGLFTFGGGYAMLPMLQKEIVERHKWAKEDEIMDYFAIGQVTPGIIAINTSTFVGYKTKGIIGGIVATAGIAFPSLIIITVIAAFLKNFASYKPVQYAFNGVRACVCVLIFEAVRKMAKKSVVDKFCLVIFIVVIVLSITNWISPALIVVLSGISGILIKNFVKKGDK